MKLRRLLPLFYTAAFAVACQRPVPGTAEVGLLATLDRASLERPIALAGPGIGALRHPVTTARDDARRFYEQGRAYLASFDWVRAARSFHAALRRDPGLAPAHLGLARAFLGLESLREAALHVQEAVRLGASAKLMPWEKAWIELGALQVTAVEAWSRGSRREQDAYLAAIERYIERFPDDIHALILRGNADPHPGAWGQAGQASAERWYRAALARDPTCFAANHFLAHTYENLGRYPAAREQAQHYAARAPDVPHAHHMLAHVLPRLGAWEEALAHLEEAGRLHRQSFLSGETSPRDDWHYGHNLRLLAAVHLRLGHVSEAEKAYRATFALPLAGRRAGFYCLPWIEYLLSRERFGEALAAAERCEQRESALARVLGASLRGEALLGLGRSDLARQALEQARTRRGAFLSSLTAAASEGMFVLTARSAVGALEGKLALEAGHLAAGQAMLLEVIDMLATGHSFDAWALGRLRIGEIASHALGRGHVELASEATARQKQLEAAAAIPIAMNRP